MGDLLAGGKRARPDSTQDEQPTFSEMTHKRARVASKSGEPPCSAYQDVFEYPEVFLNILSFLSVEDLVTFERVNKYWRRICTDQWLWKRIYLAKYPYPSIRQQRARRRSYHSSSSEELALVEQQARGASPTDEGFSAAPAVIQPGEPSLQNYGSTPKTLNRPLPAPSEDLESQEFSRPRVDWKLLTKIDTNWATGTAGQYSLSPSPSPAPAPSSSRRTHLQDSPTKRNDGSMSIPTLSSQPGSIRNAGVTQRQQQPERHLLALSSPFIFVSYPTSPLLHVHASTQAISDTGGFSKNGLASQNPPLALIPPPPGWSSLSRPDFITCIKVDSNDLANSAAGSSTNHALPVRIAVFYQSGGFVILSVNPRSMPSSSPTPQTLPRVTWSRVLVHKPSNSLSRARRSIFHARTQGDPVVVAQFHSPILISCSQKFYISVWQLPESVPVSECRSEEARHPPLQGNEDATLLKTLHSPVSFHPATLSLSDITAQHSKQEEDNENDEWESANHGLHPQPPSHYRASLAYAVPLYPERWTLAVQDFDISLPGKRTPTTSLAAFGTVEVGDCFHVGRSSVSGSYRLPLRWPLRPTSEIVGVKGDSAIGIGLDDNFAVLAGSDNQIQVYKVPERSSLTSHSSSGIADLGSKSMTARSIPHQPHDANAIRRELTHVQTLLAHSSAITAIALENGRCVSAGNDEKILVWNVDREADIVPADDGTGLELEEVDPADLLGGWTTVGSAMDKESSQLTDGAKWSHVEVRTSRRQASAISTRHNPTRSGKNAARESTAKLHPLSSCGTLHQQILPMPPVTHPLSLANAAREYLPTPRSRNDKSNSFDSQLYPIKRVNRVVEQLAFNEDRIVGLVRPRDEDVGERLSSSDMEEGVIKVWTFDV